MNNKRTAVYVKYLDETYRLLLVELRDDSSIYIYYPRKDGYYVSYSQTIEFNPLIPKQTISFGKDDTSKIFNPYISYHPGKGVVHANAKDENNTLFPFVKDRTANALIDFANKPEFIPVCSIIFNTNLTTFEKKKPNKKDAVLEIKKQHLFKQKDEALYVEVYAMPKFGYLHPDELKYKQHRKLIGIHHFDLNPNSYIYYAVVVNVIDRDKNDDNQTMNFIWSKEDPVLFVLKPIKNDK